MCSAALCFVAVLPLLPLRGQNPAAPNAVAHDPAALMEREQRLTARAVQGLHAVADALQAQKQHKRALDLRRELWQEYAEDDVLARERCGFVKVGDLWRHDENRFVLDKDMKVDQKVLRKVEQDQVALYKELLVEHRALAEGWTAAGDALHAQRHWQRVLRFTPGDKAATTALAVDQFEGFRGSPGELAMLQRARAIRGAVDWLNRKQFDVQLIEGRKQALLVAAKLTHAGARSEHYEVWGTLPPALLQTIAQDAERTLLLCHMLFGTSGGQAFTPKRRRNLLFVHDPAAYGAVLDLCAAQFDATRLAFLKKDVDQAFLEWEGESLRFHKAALGEPAARDVAVRGVAQDAIGVTTDGLWEGLGHAACGFLFGRTLTFLLEQQTQHTVATWNQRPLLPDLAVWRQIAEESAWAKSDTRTSELVLISAARFTTEQRVKSWAMCDYLFHWRPELILELDHSQTKDIRTPPDVEAEFLRRTQVDLPKLDLEWREFWARGAALRKAMATDPAGDEKAPDRAARVRARSLVDAVDEVRAAALRGPVGFFVASGTAPDAVFKFAEQLAKAEAEQKKKPKVAVPLPTPPAALGRTLFWSRRTEPTEAVAEWLVRPALRDVLLDPGRGLFGAPLAGPSWVLDVALPSVPTKSGVPLCWPRHGQPGITGQAVVAELGPRAAAALAAADKQPADVVGMPLSLHFSRTMTAAALGSVGCRVFVGNLAVQGVLVVYEDDSKDGDSAAGCVAFVPLLSMPSGSRVEIQWTLPDGVLDKKETFAPVEFLVQ